MSLQPPPQSPFTGSPSKSQIQEHSRSPSGSKTAIKSTRLPAFPMDEPIATALSEIQARYTITNVLSLEAYNEACQDFPGGNTRTVIHTSPFPITFVSGKGCELVSVDGGKYVDFLGEYSAGIFGHDNEEIASTIAEAMKKGWNFGGPNQYEKELARKITKRFSPSGIELVRFTNSGTEANTMAIAAATSFTSRKKILAFKNGYHGGTLSFPSIPSEINVNLPHDFIYAPYNDISGTSSIISALPPSSLAAIIVEPIQGSGGCIVGTPSFLKYLNTTAQQLGALFIIDEVMTSRLSYHGLSAALNLTPDLITLGKWIGGGMTFGAFGGRRSGGVMSMFDPRNGILQHSGTFNNNIITMAAGCTGLTIYNEEKVHTLNALGNTLKTSIQNIIQTHIPSSTSPKSISITGQGSILSIHFHGSPTYEKNMHALFFHHMLENGIYTAPRGFVALNLELRGEHVEKFVIAVEGFLMRFLGYLV